MTSIVIVRRETSTIFARKISANWMISARFSTAAETLNSAISRATVSSGSMSRILSTLTSLWSCLVTWSIGWTAPSRVSVIREIARVVGRADRERVDVEAAAGEQAGDPRQHARFVLDQDREDVLAAAELPGDVQVLELDQLRGAGLHQLTFSGASTMSRAAWPGGIIG